MSNYRRLISYIYAYEGGVKGKNIGFAKIEVRGEQCRIYVNVKKIYVGSNDIGVYLLAPSDEILLGRIFVRGGNGEFRMNVNSSDVEGSGCAMEACYGLTIHDVESAWQCYTTIWEDAVTQAAETTLAEVTAEQVRKQKEEHEGESKREDEGEHDGGNADAAGISKEVCVRSLEELPISAEIERELEEEEERGREMEEQEREMEEQERRERELREQEEKRTENENSETEKFETEESEIEKSEKEKSEAENQVIENSATEECEKEEWEKEKRKVEIEETEIQGTEMQEVNLQKAEIPETEISDTASAELRLSKPEGVSESEVASKPEKPILTTVPDANLAPEPEDIARLQELDRQEKEALSRSHLWNRLQRRYTKVLAFDYENGCEILSIKPQDIGLLPREIWVYGNNSFLLHGYYNYRHLILAKLNNPKGEPRYLLGVPGHYFSNEKYMASMFGFPHFVLARRQPEHDGRFGYWYTDIRI